MKSVARTPDRVKEFLTDLSRKLGPLADEELEVMKQLKAEEEGLPSKEDAVIHMWDFRYYMNMVEERNYQVNDSLTH